MTFGARCGFGWRSRTGAREKVQGRSPRGFVACRNYFGDFGKLFGLFDIFSDRSRRFPINRGRGGGRVRNFFSEIFFFRHFWGRGGGRVTPKPEARVARFLLGMFRNRFFEAGVETEKVSPKVLLDQAIDEKVSPKVSLDRKCHQKYRSINRSMKKCHEKWSFVCASVSVS